MTTEILPTGTLPTMMRAATLRPERYGEPVDAFAIEDIPVPRPGPGQVLVRVMAAGINYNNVWSARGRPVDVIAMRQRAGDPLDFHIGGSDASGIVHAVGAEVTSVREGDEVVLACGVWDRDDPDRRLGGDPTTGSSMRIWGYETNYGSFAEYTLVEDYQCHPRPQHLSWEQSAAYLLVGATAYRQLTGWPPHTVQPGDPVLVWGGSGGLGSLAIQIVRELGGRPVAVTSTKERAEHCRRLGAVGVVDRTRFSHWGRLPDPDDTATYDAWLRDAKSFGRAVWDALGERRNPAIVLEHVGEDTVPTSVLVCDTAGMVVLCGGTSGYAGDVDVRYLWMRQKRFQGSHFATREQCAALNDLVIAGRIDPCLAEVHPLEEVGLAHQLLADNLHPPGNIAIRIG